MPDESSLREFYEQKLHGRECHEVFREVAEKLSRLADRMKSGQAPTNSYSMDLALQIERMTKNIP